MIPVTRFCKCSAEHGGAYLNTQCLRCVSVYKYIKNLYVKTDKWLIGATELEVKGMYTSQEYTSLVLTEILHCVSSLAKNMLQN